MVTWSRFYSNKSSSNNNNDKSTAIVIITIIMSLINYETSSLPYVKDKLIFFPPGPNAGLPGTPLSYVAVDDLGRFFRQQCLYETVYGVQLGATFIVFLMLVFLTRRSQRETWLFRFNALALLMNIARVISLLVPYFTALADPYAMASTDLSLVRPGTIAALVLEVWFNLFLVICCYSSLFLQAQSLTSTLWGRKRVVFICMNWSMAIIPPLARFIAAIPYSMDIVNRTRKLPAWVNTFVMGVFAFGTSYHALLFVGKLGYSMHTRKKLGLRQFGPIQVVFIMLCQTMFLPGKFFSPRRTVLNLRAQTDMYRHSIFHDIGVWCPGRESVQLHIADFTSVFFASIQFLGRSYESNGARGARSTDTQIENSQKVEDTTIIKLLQHSLV